MRRSRLIMLGFGLALMLVSQIPLFVMAHEIDKDEWQKFGSAIALSSIAAISVLAREIWRYATGLNMGPTREMMSVPIVDDTSDPRSENHGS